MSGIGSIFVLAFGISQAISAYLTKNSDDIALANQLYKVKVKDERTQLGGSDQE
jgi:hypothetical protein